VPEHPLDGAQRKIERASEHQRTLRREIKAFAATNPYSVGVEFDAASGWHVARLRVSAEPPIRLSVIAGEMAYEYISALNHVAWVLAARKRGRERAWKKRTQIQFPIALDPAGFAAQPIVKNSHVSRSAIAAFAGLQPYTGRDGEAGARNHSLWHLKEIADSDKHRVLAPRISSMLLREIEYDWPNIKRGDRFKIERLLRPCHRLYDGKALGRIRFADNRIRVVSASHGDLNVDVSFGAGEWMLSVRDFGDARAFMNRALGELALLFPPRPDADG
jgi:hypothetical protein